MDCVGAESKDKSIEGAADNGQSIDLLRSKLERQRDFLFETTYRSERLFRRTWVLSSVLLSVTLLFIVSPRYGLIISWPYRWLIIVALTWLAIRLAAKLSRDEAGVNERVWITL